MTSACLSRRVVSAHLALAAGGLEAELANGHRVVLAPGLAARAATIVAQQHIVALSGRLQVLAMHAHVRILARVVCRERLLMLWRAVWVLEPIEGHVQELRRVGS